MAEHAATAWRAARSTTPPVLRDHRDDVPGWQAVVRDVVTADAHAINATLTDPTPTST